VTGGAVVGATVVGAAVVVDAPVVVVAAVVVVDAAVDTGAVAVVFLFESPTAPATPAITSTAATGAAIFAHRGAAFTHATGPPAPPPAGVVRSISVGSYGATGTCSVGSKGPRGSSLTDVPHWLVECERDSTHVSADGRSPSGEGGNIGMWLPRGFCRRTFRCNSALGSDALFRHGPDPAVVLDPDGNSIAIIEVARDG
jgi:hypothetical protein